MKTMTLNYYMDLGHGWVKIHLDKLKDVGIKREDISHYSYLKGKHVYLEEDCDLNRLYQACDKLNITIKLREYHTDKRSKIRSYQAYYSQYDNWGV